MLGWWKERENERESDEWFVTFRAIGFWSHCWDRKKMSGKILKLFFCFRQREKIGRIFSALLDKEFDKDVMWPSTTSFYMER
jgi:hypothetical protein